MPTDDDPITLRWRNTSMKHSLTTEVLKLLCGIILFPFHNCLLWDRTHWALIQRIPRIKTLMLLFTWLTKVLGKRQRTAFPPNFVHSLDGSHMMMTAVACKEAGLNFAGFFFLVILLFIIFYWVYLCVMRALFVLVTLTTLYKYMVTGVHDSYWTHACDVDKMNRILREKFVELYEAPILEDVSMCTSIFMQLNKPPSFISFWFSLHLGNYVTFYLAIFRNN